MILVCVIKVGVVRSDSGDGWMLDGVMVGAFDTFSTVPLPVVVVVVVGDDMLCVV